MATPTPMNDNNTIPSPRWIDDDHPDAVQSLKKASQYLKAPPLWKKIFMLPLFGIVAIVSILPIIAVFTVYLITSKSRSNQQKVQVQASKTATAVALIRHYFNLLDLCGDNLAYLFLPLVFRMVFGVLSLFTIYTGRLPEIRNSRVGTLQVRCEIGDELTRRFVIKQDGKQIVLLGAGFDTRAYRLDCLKSTKYKLKIYEVDIITTQKRKLSVLDSNHIDRSHVTYVPVDFSVETFRDCLLKSGWDESQPTLFLWEGCSMYLPEAAIHDTLRAISKCASGSYLFLDIFTDIFTEEGKKQADKYPGAHNVVKYVKSRGEPFQWGLLDPSRKSVSNFLSLFNLELVEHLSSNESEDIFLTNADGIVAGHCTGISTYVIAKVP